MARNSRTAHQATSGEPLAMPSLTGCVGGGGPSGRGTQDTLAGRRASSPATRQPETGCRPLRSTVSSGEKGVFCLRPPAATRERTRWRRRASWTRRRSGAWGCPRLKTTESPSQVRTKAHVCVSTDLQGLAEGKALQIPHFVHQKLKRNKHTQQNINYPSCPKNSSKNKVLSEHSFIMQHGNYSPNH